VYQEKKGQFVSLLIHNAVATATYAEQCSFDRFLTLTSNWQLCLEWTILTKQKQVYVAHHRSTLESVIIPNQNNQSRVMYLAH